jgi:predicted nucleotidyltransferase
MLFFGRSETRKRILNLFFTQPDKAAHVRQVAREIGALASGVGRELERLEGVGILRSEMVGRSRVYRLNATSAIANDARTLFQKTRGVEARLGDVLTHVRGIEQALLFGSYADSSERAGSDLDLLIIGEPRMAELSAALAPLEDEFGRAIHVTSMPPSEFEQRKARPGFVASVLNGPRIMLVADGHAV